MTRINVVPVSELTDKHLTGENHEILRPLNLVRKAIARKINKYNFNDKVKCPDAYTMGTGHVLFFYNKLGFILNRYQELQDEMRLRGYSPNSVSVESLKDGIDAWWFGDYTPTTEALKINRQRLAKRLQEMSQK